MENRRQATGYQRQVYIWKMIVMLRKKRKELYVCTLGTLDARYGGEPLDIPLSAGGKVIQLFLLLIWAGKEGISRVKLQDSLYDRKNTDEMCIRDSFLSSLDFP